MKIILFLIIALTCKHFSFAQNKEIKFSPPVVRDKEQAKPATTRLHVSDDMGHGISVEVRTKGGRTGKTNEDGWITLENLQLGDTITVTGMDLGFFTKQYIHRFGSPKDDIYLLLESANPAPPPVKQEEQVFVTIEDPADFPGGRAALYKFLAENLKYPERAVRKGLQGKCYIRFIVETDGTISDAIVQRGVPDCPECDAEALRVVQMMPKWKPAGNGQGPLKSYYNLPIAFRLD
jgi:protein TonB